MVVTRGSVKKEITHPSIVLPSISRSPIKRTAVSSQSSIFSSSPPSTQDFPELNESGKREATDDDFETYVAPRVRHLHSAKKTKTSIKKTKRSKHEINQAVSPVDPSHATDSSPITSTSSSNATAKPTIKPELGSPSISSPPLSPDRKGKGKQRDTRSTAAVNGGDAKHDINQDNTIPRLRLLNGPNLDTYLSSDLQIGSSSSSSSMTGDIELKVDQQQGLQHDSELKQPKFTVDSFFFADDNDDDQKPPSLDMNLEQRTPMIDSLPPAVDELVVSDDIGDDLTTTDDSDEDGFGPDEFSFRGGRGRQRGRRRGRGHGRRVPSGMSWHERTKLKLATNHPELKHVWNDLRAKERIPVVPIGQPENLILPLLPFQKYGVAWMIQQEKDESFNGGILADEMGMGKTIQTISLLLSDYGMKPNLVIAPTVAIMQWQTEIEKHTKNDMKVHIFHGGKRETSLESLSSYDIVITTYSVAEVAFRKQEHGTKRDGKLVKEKSLLHRINWHRIILDEAHNIKDRSCGTARSVFALNGKYRWSLSGTPLQNRVGELYSLIRFSQADPFGYYFCKSCDCKCLNWKFADNSYCVQCKHTPMEHVCWWNNEVLKPIQANGYVGEGRVAMDKLSLLLDRIMLRRTKIQCADDLGLPPRTITVRRDVFNDAEEEVYLSLFTDTARRFSSYVEDGSVLNNYANIFELLTKMRQCANHPDLVTKKKGMSGNKQLVCMLCNDLPEDAIFSACKHTFCRECCVQYLESFDNSVVDSSTQTPKCPSCYANFTVDLTQPAVDLEFDGEEGQHPAFSKSSIVNRIDMEKWRSSTKIEALVEELSKLQTEDRTIKSIVFSQFVSFLDLVYWRLSRMGFCCIRLDGSMSPTQRAAAIEHFSNNPTVTVFLISLKAGGVALNLTEASRVFICDPWWNPAAELQAMDRIHRLGQHRPIRITRLVIENSIESRIIQLQEKKTALVNSTIDKDQSALERLSVDDLKFLFVL